MNFSHVLISAENREQATVLLDALLEKKLVLGGPILEGPAKFWWKGEIVEMSYAYVLTYTTEKLKDEVMRVAGEASEEEVPMISFILFEGNPELLKLINDTL